MRNIERNIVVAVNNRFSYKSENTRVEVVNNNVFVYLHDNLIYKTVNNVVFFTLAGQNTPTTRSRLNALGVDVCVKKSVVYHNEKPISVKGWHVV